VYLAIPSGTAGDDLPNGAILRFKVGESAYTTLTAKIDPTALAVDAKNLYWSDKANPGIYQKPTGSEDDPIQLATITAGFLVSDGATVYGASISGNEILSVAIGGSATTVLSQVVGESLTVSSRYVGLDAQHVYAWLYDGTGTTHLQQLTKPAFHMLRGVATSAVESFTAPIVADGSNVYFGESGGLYRVSANTSGSPISIANLTGALTGLTIANGVLYWLDQGASDADGVLYRLVL